MERNRNWLGWAALALAGLALLVALGGRGPFGSDRFDRVVAVPAAPGAPVAPEVPGSPRFGRGEIERQLADIDRLIAEREGFGRAHGPMGHFERGHGFERHGHRGFGFFPLFGLIRGLVNLAALGLLGYLLLTIWRQRRAAPAGPGAPPPTTPAGHDPRVE